MVVLCIGLCAIAYPPNLQLTCNGSFTSCSSKLINLYFKIQYMALHEIITTIGIKDFPHSIPKLVGFVQLEKLTKKTVNFPKSYAQLNFQNLLII